MTSWAYMGQKHGFFILKKKHDFFDTTKYNFFDKIFVFTCPPKKYGFFDKYLYAHR